MKTLKSCGVLVFRTDPSPSFLVMRHRNRLDLPKGHLEEGESEEACALRELREETGILASQIELHDGFRFSTSYRTPYQRFGGEVVKKTVVIFLAWLKEEVEIHLGEHPAYEWLGWPSSPCGAPTIDQLLKELDPVIKARVGD